MTRETKCLINILHNCCLLSFPTDLIRTFVFFHCKVLVYHFVIECYCCYHTFIVVEWLFLIYYLLTVMSSVFKCASRCFTCLTAKLSYNYTREQQQFPIYMPWFVFIGIKNVKGTPLRFVFVWHTRKVKFLKPIFLFSSILSHQNLKIIGSKCLLLLKIYFFPVSYVETAWESLQLLITSQAL